MASSIVGSAVINAGAFTLGSWLMRYLDPTNYQEETKRYHKAMERLTQDRNKFFEDAQLRREKIAKLEAEKKNTEVDFKLTNAQFAQLKLLKHQESLAVEPQLHQFYKPSKEMKEYQMLSIGIIGAMTGATVGAVVKSFLF